jgi:hypothetical protein
MKAHAQRQSQPRQDASLQLARPARRAAVNQLVAADANAEALQAAHEQPAPNVFAHDFSRIPVHSRAPVRPQAKLAMGAPGDAYEREADRIAERVTGTAEPRHQSACACGGGCNACKGEGKEDERLRAKRDARAGTGAAEAPHVVGEVLGSSGRPLDAPVREFMESRFGHDFSRVRVHTGERAADSARAVNALAYTVGSDVVFGHGRYAPHTSEGRSLLAHELTHTIQQRGGTDMAGAQSPHTHAATGGQPVAVSMQSGPRVSGLWPFDGEEETLAFKSVEAEVKYRLDKNDAAEDQKAYSALNGQNVTAMLATLEKLKTDGLVGTLIGRFNHATGVNRPRLWVALSCVQYKGWGGAEESLKTELAQMRAAGEGAQADEMLAYRKANTAEGKVADVTATPAAEKQEEKKAAPSKGAAGVVEKIKKEYGEYITDASKKYSISEQTIVAVIATESKGVADASSGAAYGLMQVTKGTWEGTRKVDEALKDYDFDTYWKDAHVNILFGASVLKSNMKSMGVKSDDPNSAKLAIVAYNAGLGTVKAAIAAAKEGGSATPEADCLKPEYLKPAIKSTGIHSYYLTGSGHKSNSKIKEVKKDESKKTVVVPVEGATLEQAEEEAVNLKYKEVSQYPDKVSEYMAAQTTNAPAGDKAASGDKDAAASAEPEKATLQSYKLSDKNVELVKESDEKETLSLSESPATYVRNALKGKIDYDAFYKEFTTVKFFDHTISPPIHKDFAATLKKIESDYAKDKTPKAAGEALGVKSVGGSRDYPTSAAFSMHLVGMAVDINYTDSPFIGSSSSDVFGRAGLLIDGTAYSYDETSRTYEQLSTMQKAITAYFALLDDDKKLEEKLKSASKTKWTVSKSTKHLALASSWEGMALDLAKKQIQTDLAHVAARWERKEDQIKKGGFLGVSKELVDTMTKGNATHWGGGGYGDMMHFDMRTQGKGAIINAAFNDYKKKKTEEAHKKYEDEGPEARKTRRAAEKAAAEEKAKAAREAKAAKKKKK